MSPVENGFNVLPCFCCESLKACCCMYDWVGEVETAFGDDESPRFIAFWNVWAICWGADIRSAFEGRSNGREFLGCFADFYELEKLRKLDRVYGEYISPMTASRNFSWHHRIRSLKNRRQTRAIKLKATGGQRRGRTRLAQQGRRRHICPMASAASVPSRQQQTVIFSEKITCDLHWVQAS